MMLGHIFRKDMQINSFLHENMQSTLSSSNMANSNSFLSPQEILLIAQESKYLCVF